MFDQSDLNALAQPDHLRQLPAEDVERVVSIIRSNLPDMPHGLGLEITAWAETRTIHDAKRCIGSLRFAYSHEHLAREIEEIMPEESRP